jgi:ATP-dependent DNA helicase HFM1/MER3
MIDLVDDDPSSSHEHLSHSDYNNEKSVRLPKKKPKFSYASGQQPNLTFLSELESTVDPLGFDDETQEDDLPSPSALFNIPDDTDFPFDRIETDPAHIATDAPESPEAARSAFDEPVEPKTPARGVSSSFENGVFDFSAFNDDSGERQVYSSPPMQSSLKRRLLSPAPTQVKCRRVNDMVMIGSNEPVSQGDSITCKFDAPQPRSTPAWLDDFDQDLINSLKGIVEFVD